MKEEIITLIKYRLERAKETLEDAKILFNNKRYNSCVNRIYYAMFYSVLALLRTKNLIAAKHSGVKSLFHKEFVKKGKIPVKMGKFYNKMFIKRSESDYEDFKKFEKKEVEEYLKKAEEFINLIEKIVKKEISE